MSIYQSLFDLIHNFIYGGVTMSADMNLVCTLLSTIGVVFCVSLPFVVVYKFICILCGR